MFVSTIMDRDLKVPFNKNNTQTLDLKGKVIGKGTQRNNVYELSAFNARADVSNNKLCHERFGHLDLNSLKEMHKSGMIADLPEITDLPNVCETSIMGKQHWQSSSRGR